MDSIEFKRIFRVSKDSFTVICNVLNPKIVQSNRGRPPIPSTTKIGLYMYFIGHITDYVACGNFLKKWSVF